MSKQVVFALSAFTLLGMTQSADAVVILGNPDLDFRVDRPQGDYINGSVYLDKVRVHSCNGTFKEYSVDAWVDPVAGHTITIDGGDLCGATWYWDSLMHISGEGFSVKVLDQSTYAPLDPLKSSWFSSWSFVGNMPGTNGPELIPNLY